MKSIKLPPPPRDAPRHHAVQPRRRARTPKSAEADGSPTVKSQGTKGRESASTTSPRSRTTRDPTSTADMNRSSASPQSQTRSPTSRSVISNNHINNHSETLSPKSSSTKASTRSKKILVVDPKTQKKYPLNTDDHSLTDKELLVFHRPIDQRIVFGASSPPTSPHRCASYYPTRDQHSISGQTISTASALTDAEHYGGKMYGSCHVRSCAALPSGTSVEEARQDEDMAPAKRAEAGDERDVAEAATSPALPSPLAALSLLASPWNKSLSSPLAAVQSFFPKWREDVRCKRIGVVVFPHHFGSSGSEKKYSCGLGEESRDGTLMGMRLTQCPIDFMAHVRFVERGSLAERAGVARGDVVSFAISLSNMTSNEPQNTLLAEKLIKRLESVGMRTSYRELFDIFLSKTTNSRPVGMVFRRFHNRPWGGGVVNPVSPRALSPRSIPNGESLFITDEFDWSTDFLRSMSVKCREYEFERCVPFHENQVVEKDAPVLSFLPRPNSSLVSTATHEAKACSEPAAKFSSIFDWAGRYNCASPFVSNHCGSKSAVQEYRDTAIGGTTGMDKLFLSNRLLCSLMEQAVGLVFVRRCVDVSYIGGGEGNPSEKKVSCTFASGFVVVRKTEGEWSAPCFLEVVGSKSPSDNFTESSFESVHMIIINKKELAGRLILGDAVKFSVCKKQLRVNVLVRDAAIIANNKGRFELMVDFFVVVKVCDDQNQAFYSAMTPLMTVTPKDILVGTLSPPEQSVDFYGALQSLELPYSMHAHPVIPEMIQPYCTSDWSDFIVASVRNKSGNMSVSSALSGGGMKTMLKLVAKGDSIDDKREIDVFARRFQYYLMDGVPVHVILPSTVSSKEEKILRLTIKESLPFSDALLELSRKRRPGIINVGMQGNYVATMGTITKLSRTPPPGLDLDDEEKRRFFSFETDLSGGPIMMLVKSKKDSLLLLCGLKLLLEREKIICR